jgi:hypothetical protein
MKDNNVNGIRKHILVKCIYFPPYINLNDIDDNTTTIIKLAAKREMKDTNTKHTTNLM